jgi:hypothetical protein
MVPILSSQKWGLDLRSEIQDPKKLMPEPRSGSRGQKASDQDPDPHHWWSVPSTPLGYGKERTPLV